MCMCVLDYASVECMGGANGKTALQGSHRVWKTGKTGKKIMVREKSGNFILGQKSGKSQGILF